MARASDINLSTPNKMAMLSIGITFKAVSVEARTINPLPVTPAAPLDVTINTPIIVSCWPMLRLILKTCERKITAMERYMDVPSRLNEYPVGITSPTTGLEQPNFSIFNIILGSTDSDEDVPRTITISCLMNFRYFQRLNLNK